MKALTTLMILGGLVLAAGAVGAADRMQIGTGLEILLAVIGILLMAAGGWLLARKAKEGMDYDD